MSVRRHVVSNLENTRLHSHVFSNLENTSLCGVTFSGLEHHSCAAVVSNLETKTVAQPCVSKLENTWLSSRVFSRLENVEPRTQVEEYVKTAFQPPWQIQTFGNTIMAWDSQMLAAGDAQEHALFPNHADARKHWRNFWTIALDPTASFAAASGQKWFVLTTHTVSGSHVFPKTDDTAEIDRTAYKHKSAWDNFKLECLGITCHAATMVSVELG